VQHEVAVEVALDGLDLLLVGLRAERGGDERLGLAAREHARAVRPRQVGDVDRDRADLVDLAAVDADAALHDEPPHLGLLDRLEGFANRGLLGLVHAEALDHLVEYAGDRLSASLLFVCGQRRGELARGQALDPRLQLGVPRCRLDRPAGLAGALHQIALGARELLALGVAERDRFEHRLFGDLAGTRFDHQYRVFGGRDDELDARRLFLRRRGIRGQLAVDQPDADGADGAVERDTRQT